MGAAMQVLPCPLQLPQLSRCGIVLVEVRVPGGGQDSVVPLSMIRAAQGTANGRVVVVLVSRPPQSGDGCPSCSLGGNRLEGRLKKKRGQELEVPGPFVDSTKRPRQTASGRNDGALASLAECDLASDRRFRLATTQGAADSHYDCDTAGDQR